MARRGWTAWWAAWAMGIFGAASSPAHAQVVCGTYGAEARPVEQTF